MDEREPVLFCWSGGKDSAMALHALLQDPKVRIVALLTTLTEGYNRVSMHGVRRELLQRQAESIGLPLHEVFIPPECVNPIYEVRMEAALRGHFENGVRKVAFGDIFLEDLRAYREKNLARIGMTALFPIWKRDSRELIDSFHAQGFRSIAVCVNCKLLDRSFVGRELDTSFFADLPAQVDWCGENGEFHTFAGRELDASFFADLPAQVDCCGENGEFHTFAFGGPIFGDSVRFQVGGSVERDSFVFCDLLVEKECQSYEPASSKA